MLWVPPLPPSGDGLVGEYYDNIDLTGSATLTRTDSQVDFDWGTGSPDAAIPSDAFSVRWTGHVLAQYDETYTFYVATGDDEGARLTVDGVSLVDDWASPAAGEHSGTIALSAGERYSVTLEYFEDSGPADVQLSWSSSTSTPKAVVPQAQLFSAPVPLAVNPEMRDHLKYLSQFVGDLACLDDPTLTDATVGVAGGDSPCEAWGMRTAGRGFAWIHDTDTGASPSLDGETFTVSGLTPGDYGVFWYDVWTSGAAYVPEPAPITVAGDGILTVTVPALARPDIAMRFLPSPETPTPVVMSSVRARSVGAGALIKWTTASEIDNAGFDVLRRGPVEGLGAEAGVERDFERVTPRPVEGRITAAGEKAYSWFDLVRPGTWEYRVETVSTTGERERHGSGPDVTVTVRPGDAAGAMRELASAAAGRLAAGLRDSRSRADTSRARDELARRPRRPKAPPRVAPGARILRSVADRTGALPPDATFRPSAGDAKIVTRGDGVFLVPASTLGTRPGRTRFVTGGTESPPLAVGREGAWFFAPGYRDSYTDLNATFVVEGGDRGADASGARPSVHAHPRRPASEPAITTARACSRAETDGMYAIGLPGLLDPWVDPRWVNDSSGEVAVDVDAPGLVPGPATLRVAVCGYTEDPAREPDHELIVSLNGAAVARFEWDGREHRVLEVALPAGAAREGANAVGLLAPRSPAIPRGHGVVLDYVEIEHERRLSLEDGAFALELASGAGPRAVEVDLGARGGAPWVVEIDASGRSTRLPARVVADGTGAVARFTAREGSAYYVTPAGGARSPERITRARVATVEPGTDYVAVGPEEFRGASAPLIEMHRAEGMRARYVSLDEAADTWGWGRYGAAAISSLARAAGPRYLLLVGDNAYDYLGRVAGEADPMVPAFLARPSKLAETNADALYGDVDSDGAPDIPVGRLPVRTAGELANLVRKIVAHAAAGSERGGVLLAGRSGADEDFAGASRRVAARFVSIAWTELYAGVHGDEAAVRAALARTVDAGTDVVVYQGHGAVSALGKGLPLLDPAAAAEWRSAPVVYLATCWGAFIQHETDDAKSIAETLLRARGGSPAVVGSTTPCAQWAQQMLLMDFLESAIERGEPLGDALVAAQRRAARRAASAGPAAAASLMDVARFYALLGDPAMGLAGPAPRE
ncbi:MAG: C25 family cysteine peptidase [Planctomycetota bacterium]